jgi:hypothetical protein
VSFRLQPIAVRLTLIVFWISATTAATEQDIHRRLSLCVNPYTANYCIASRYKTSLRTGYDCEVLCLPTTTPARGFQRVRIDTQLNHNSWIQRNYNLLIWQNWWLGKKCWFILTKTLSLVCFKPAARIMIYRGRLWLGQIVSAECAGCVNSGELSAQCETSCMSRQS